MLPDHIAAAVRHHWWLFLLRGVAGVAFGVLTLLWPGATLVVLMAFIAAYALVDGIVAGEGEGPLAATPRSSTPKGLRH